MQEAFSWLLAAPLQCLPLWSHGLLLFCLSQVSLCLSLIRTFVIGFKAHPDNARWSHLKILNLIPSSKTLFPNKVTFTVSGASGCAHIFGGYAIKPIATIYTCFFRVCILGSGMLGHRRNMPSIFLQNAINSVLKLFYCCTAFPTLRVIRLFSFCQSGRYVTVSQGSINLQFCNDRWSWTLFICLWIFCLFKALAHFSIVSFSCYFLSSLF